MQFIITQMYSLSLSVIQVKQQKIWLRISCISSSSNLVIFQILFRIRQAVKIHLHNPCVICEHVFALVTLFVSIFAEIQLPSTCLPKRKIDDDC